MRRALALLGLLAAGMPACAHRAEEPGAVLASFGAAVGRGDLRSAYRLTTDAYQRRVPFEAFAAGFAAEAGEPATLGRRLSVEATKVAPRVEVELALGERVPLVLEAAGWRIDGPVFEAWGQGTPRAALRTFVRAIDERRYDVLMRLVPDRYLPGLSPDRLRAFWEGTDREDHHAMLERIRAALGGPVVESATEARLAVPPDRAVRLVREAGRWKIEDPDEY
jgi:hypothetical protein